MGETTMTTKRADRFRIEGLPELSGTAMEFLRRRPQEAQVAVTIALETAAETCRIWSGRADADTPERMKHHFIHMALDVALEIAAAQQAVLADVVPDAVPEPLKPFVVRRAQSDELIGVLDAAIRLKVSRTTVYDWVERRKLLAWKTTKRGYRIPLAQILGPGKVVPGLARVLEIIDDPELAWAFLSQDWPFALDTARPLDKLARNEVEDVVRAAPGFGMSFT